MFFIPFFRKVDWTNPPLVTLLLILINCLIFIIFQSEDDAHTEKAYAYYLESDLPKLEIPLYFDYLKKNNRWKKVELYQKYLDEGEEYTLAVVVPMRQDPQFMQQLEAGKLFTEESQFNTWKTQQQKFDSELQKAVWYAYGLKPNEPTAVTFFTNMFLHGSWGHLIGNMVFLFIIGFVVESALGKSSYTAGYLLAGLCGGALYIVFNSDSQTATVGASGAIAGLMGMYTVVFGLRKINFFYFVLVYFDYVKAPAIVLLPIWLGHEIIQLLMETDQGVNYFAHIGGICSGAVFAFTAKNYLRNLNLDYLDQNEKEDAQKNRFEQGMDLLAQLKIQEATQIFRSLAQEYPDNRNYLLQWYATAKRLPASEDFHAAAKRIMLLTTKDQQTYKLIHGIHLEYIKLAQPKPQLSAQLVLQIITPLVLGGFLEDAERLLLLAKNSKPQEQVAERALILANAFHKANNPVKYKQYLHLIAKEFSQTPIATEAIKRLQWLKTANQ